MNVVKLRLKKRNGYWNVGDLVLGPRNLESKPFDYDVVDPRMQMTITRGVEVFKIIEMIPHNGPPEMQLGLPAEAVPFGPVSRAEISDVFEEDSAPPKEIPVLVDESWRAEAKAILEKSISKIKGFIEKWPEDQEVRQKIMMLIEEERLGKSRKTLLKFLEETFLSIPPEVE